MRVEPEHEHLLLVIAEIAPHTPKTPDAVVERTAANADRRVLLVHEFTVDVAEHERGG